ncbi:MAG: hypothetical protein JNM72_24415 [Deltaproteobacteria bacterium]|jgi:hypothetical protein|nr:hypothetical protein [Deltaproteobacteria bacterium]
MPTSSLALTAAALALPLLGAALSAAAIDHEAVTQLRAEAAPVREVAGEDGAFVAAPPVPGAAAEADRVLAAARLAEHTAPSIFGLLGLAVAGLCVGAAQGPR